MKAIVAASCANILGEGPVWHKGRNSFFWVDIEGQLVQEYGLHSGLTKSWQMPARTGMLAIVNDHELIVALQGSIVLFNLEDSSLSTIVMLDADKPMMRPNDGKCDSEGRLWVGTLNMNLSDPVGSLYMLEGNVIGEKHMGLTISNGMAWTADNSRFYFIDTPMQRIDAFVFDAEKGEIRFEETVIRIPDEEGHPDGMCIDTEGMLWVALWGGFALKRFNPFTGALLATIELPVPNVTSCTFGGENLDQLFITSARNMLTDEQLEQYPLSGHSFICTTDVKGVEPFYFKKAF